MLLYVCTFICMRRTKFLGRSSTTSLFILFRSFLRPIHTFPRGERVYIAFLFHFNDVIECLLTAKFVAQRSSFFDDEVSVMILFSV